jgi:hypothetical protein
MPRNRFLPKLSTDRDFGGDCELTPLTAIDPRPQSQALPGSRFSHESVGRSPARNKKRMSAGRQCAIAMTVLHFLLTITSITLLVLCVLEFNKLRIAYRNALIVGQFYIDVCSDGICSFPANTTAPSEVPEFRTWIPNMG